MGWNQFKNELEGVPRTVEPSIATIMGCSPWAFPMVANAEESVNILDTVYLKPKVQNNFKKLSNLIQKGIFSEH